MTTPARRLGALLAVNVTAGSGMQTANAQVVDVTDSGVNVSLGGTLLLDVQCADSYRNRTPGDWVAVRLGTTPTVLWRLGPDPGGDDEATIAQIATDAAHAVQVVSAVTWGTADPDGTGWQQATTPYARRKADGTVELYFQLGSQTDDSPTAPPARPPAPVTLSPTDAGTWRGGLPDDYASAPVQGDYTGRGNRRGGWFYGTAIADACAGKTVATMRVAFTRKAGSGVNSRRPMHLYLHTYTSAPSGQLTLGDGPQDLLALSAGGRGTATLPAAWTTALAAGTARGLAIYAAGATDYMAVTGGALTITYST
jgi:hypothetical protein